MTTNTRESKDIYQEKSSQKYAITKVGGMKLAAAANISIVDTESGPTEGCKRCLEMAKAVGKAKVCGTCPARKRCGSNPSPSGCQNLLEVFRLMKATKEIDCAAEQQSMSEKQYQRFLPHRTAIAEKQSLHAGPAGCPGTGIGIFPGRA